MTYQKRSGKLFPSMFSHNYVCFHRCYLNIASQVHDLFKLLSCRPVYLQRITLSRDMEESRKSETLLLAKKQNKTKKTKRINSSGSFFILIGDLKQRPLSVRWFQTPRTAICQSVKQRTQFEPHLRITSQQPLLQHALSCLGAGFSAEGPQSGNIFFPQKKFF